MAIVPRSQKVVVYTIVSTWIHGGLRSQSTVANVKRLAKHQQEEKMVGADMVSNTHVIESLVSPPLMHPLLALPTWLSVRGPARLPKFHKKSYGTPQRVRRLMKLGLSSTNAACQTLKKRPVRCQSNPIREGQGGQHRVEVTRESLRSLNCSMNPRISPRCLQNQKLSTFCPTRLKKLPELIPVPAVEKSAMIVKGACHIIKKVPFHC